MKYRTDSETNSSSSSFILSAVKLGDNVTKNTVFSIVKGLCLELAEKAKATDAYLKEKYNITRQWREADLSRFGCGIYRYTVYTTSTGDELNSHRNEYAHIETEIFEKFGVYTDEITPTPECELPWWINLSTYDELLKAGQERDDNGISVEALSQADENFPFRIYDYRYEKIDTQELFSDHDEVLGWYKGDYIDLRYEVYSCCEFINDKCGDEIFCNNCDKRPRCEHDDCIYESDMRFMDSLKKCPFTKCIKKSALEKQALLLQLGDICIFGWETNLSRYVNRKLSELSNHSCTHMG